MCILRTEAFLTALFFFRALTTITFHVCFSTCNLSRQPWCSLTCTSKLSQLLPYPVLKLFDMQVLVREASHFPITKSVFVCQRYRAPQFRWLKQEKLISHNYEGWKSKIKESQGWFLQRSLSLACRWLSSASVFTRSSLCVCLCPHLFFI